MAASEVVSLTGEDKNRILERYSDLDWQESADVLEELQCVRCSRILIHHYESNCHHFYCLNCRSILKPEPIHNPWNCLKCGEPITDLNQQKWEIEDKVYSLKVSCPNKTYGCKFSFALREIPNHLTTCKDTRDAALPKEIKSNEDFNDTILDSKIEGLKKYIDVTSNDLDTLKFTCESRWKYIEQLIQNVTAELKTIKDQLANDELVEVNEESKNEDKERQNKLITTLESLTTDKDAIKLLTDQFKTIFSGKQHDQMMSQMRMEIRQLRIQLREIQGNNQSTSKIAHIEVHTWPIIGFEITPEKREEILSSLITLPGFSFQAKARLIRLNNVSLWFNLFFMDKNEAKLPNVPGPLPSFTFIITDQYHRKDSNIVRKAHINFLKSIGTENEMFETSSVDHNMITNGEYVKDQCVNVKILMEPPSLAHSFQSNDGVLTWHVDNFAKRRQLMRDKLLEDIGSPYFYTSIVGYRVQMKLMTMKEMLAVRLCFLTGSFDLDLPPDFKHTTIVTLMHKDPSKNIVKSNEGSKASYDLLVFLNLSDSDVETYLFNDSLTVKAEVKPL